MHVNPDFRVWVPTQDGVVLSMKCNRLQHQNGKSITMLPVVFKIFLGTKVTSKVVPVAPTTWLRLTNEALCIISGIKFERVPLECVSFKALVDEYRAAVLDVIGVVEYGLMKPDTTKFAFLRVVTPFRTEIPMVT